jgi:hypothetical protein
MEDLKRDTMIFYRSFYESINSLNDPERLQIYDAIFDFTFTFKKHELFGISKSIFTLILPQLEANNRKFINGKKAKNKQTGSKREANRKQTGSKTTSNVLKNNVLMSNVECIKNKELKNNIFVPPTISQVKDFLEEKGIFTVDAEKFYYFYESKGWLIGKNKMKSWQSAIHTWKNSKITQQPQHEEVDTQILMHENFKRLQKERGERND